MPGYKAGGPITSCWNLSNALSEKTKVYVLTSDRDLNETHPYPGITRDQWVEIQKNLFVCYLSPTQQTYKGICQQIKTVQADVIYLNSLFSLTFTIYPIHLKWRRKLNSRIILAPRGMLKASALQFKSLKKRWFIRVLRWMRLAKWITFHATDEEEVKDIKKHLGGNAQVFLIPNMPSLVTTYIPKEIGEVFHFLFVGRIHPIKGLLEALHYLKEVKHPLTFSIIGSNEVTSYWKECQILMDTLPDFIEVNYLGEVPPAQVKEIQKKQHFFLLPTQGENFGHAIFEALAMGLPVIISDQTPWKRLQELGIGWDLPLKSPSAFIDAITAAATMPPEAYERMSKTAWQYAKDFIDNKHLTQHYLTMFGIKQD
ncbi:MAG: glycosyltransferase family 4 protein [Saprospiraceae bacterium]